MIKRDMEEIREAGDEGTRVELAPSSHEDISWQPSRYGIPQYCPHTRASTEKIRKANKYVWLFVTSSQYNIIIPSSAL